MNRCFLQTFTVVLLMAFASSSVDADGGDDDGGDVYPELPEFAEGVTVKVLNRMDSCVRQLVGGSGEWLELDFVASQKDDEGTDQEFDSTKSRGRTFFIEVDAEPEDQKHPGLREGLRGVCIGEKREITIQAGSSLMTVKSTSGLTQPDTDKDAVYSVSVRSIQDQEPTNLFAKMDKDNNLEISREEAEDFFKPYGFEKAGLLDEEVDKLFRYQDNNDDNTISFEEFQGPKHAHDEF